MEFKALIENINNELTDVRNSNESLEENINKLLGQYLKAILSIDYNVFTQYGLSKGNIINNINKSNKTILDALSQYSSAHIADCVTTIKNYLIENDKLLILNINKDSQKDNKWYRMRNQEKYKRLFPANEMFHIPFQLRGKVNTQRYSLPGYPCLYISRSIWATWEEMHEPQLSQFCVSLLEPQISFNVLDLRLRNPESIQQDDMEKVLCTLPLVISCSIKVANPDDNFKPEYIIPQMVMLALVDRQDIIGCAYTSTQRNNFFDWKDITKLDNIALPVKDVAKNGLCPKLSSMFKVSDSTNYDYEMLKQPFETTFFTEIDGTIEINTAKYYENSIFGQLENRLNDKSLKQV